MTKNADKSAMPVHDAVETCSTDGNEGLFLLTREYIGLTKREMFAMTAMQGLCAHSGDYHEFEHLADDAVNYADAVLKMLEVKL